MKDNLLFILSEPPQLCVKIPGLFPVLHQLSGFPVSQLSGHTELLLHCLPLKPHKIQELLGIKVKQQSKK